VLWGVQEKSLRISCDLRPEPAAVTLLTNTVDLEGASQFARGQLNRWSAIIAALDDSSAREARLMERSVCRETNRRIVGVVC
jgi:hypothetical protein